MNKYQNVAPVAPANMNMAQRQMAVSQAMRPNMMHLQAVGQAAPAAPAEPKKIQPIKFVKENWQKIFTFAMVAGLIARDQYLAANSEPVPPPAPVKKNMWGK